ncbi:tyrosine-type recombinase/integrase [Streptomyces sp. NPDC057302]|uniref:tyrosine-type recombinase/integrase n=1 Tax=Streptomyces sp. NPDC057302 TaxID=3346094 RepID=UPI003635B9F8
MAKAWVEDLWHKRNGKPTEYCRRHKGAKRYRSAAHGVGAQWQVRGYNDQGDALPKENWESYDEAENRARDLTTDVISGRLRQQQRGQITLTAYYETVWWPNAEILPGTRERTDQRVKSCILPYLGEKRLLDIGTEELNAWKLALRKQVASGTVRTAWQNLSKILQAACEANRIPRNPCRGLDSARPPIRPPTNKEAWGPSVFRDVRVALHPRYRALAELGVAAGLRPGEALAWSPDDLRDGWLYVDRQLQSIGARHWFKLPKRNKTRRLPVPTELEEALLAHIEAFPPVEVTLPWVDASEPTMAWEQRPKVTVRLLTATAYGNPITSNTFRTDNWNPALEEAGLVERLYRADGTPRDAWNGTAPFTFHALRHTYASVQLGAGETPVTVAEYMGDTVETVLETYAHFIPDTGGRGVEAMGNFMTAA